MLTEYFIEGRRSRNRRRSLAPDTQDDRSRDADSTDRNQDSPANGRPGGRKRAIYPEYSPERGRRSRSHSRVSEASSTTTPKRTNMRSANAEFVQKQQKFLQKVNAQSDSEASEMDLLAGDSGRMQNAIEPPPKVRNLF